MYTITHNKKNNTLEVNHSDAPIYGKIYLEAGASLQELTLNGHPIIQDLSPLTYDNTYASSILFPFANRIKDGKYEFEGETFQLKKNQEEEQNALHGLVYNKSFSIVANETGNGHAKIVLEYVEHNPSEGFPFTYKIQLNYTFLKDSLSLEVRVTNTDSKAFPFTLGWHPYFVSSNLNESELIFDSNEKVVLGARNITIGTEVIESNKTLKLNCDVLDDCWFLNSDKVLLKTPNFNLHFNASGDNNFLQAYMPAKENTIAIEPTTGVSDSFNNKIGLKVLQPNTFHAITWKLKID